MPVSLLNNTSFSIFRYFVASHCYFATRNAILMGNVFLLLHHTWRTKSWNSKSYSLYKRFVSKRCTFDSACFLNVTVSENVSNSWLVTCWIYLGVKTCEVFLCFVTIMFVLSFILTSLFSLFYVAREGDRFLHRGWAHLLGRRKAEGGLQTPIKPPFSRLSCIKGSWLPLFSQLSCDFLGMERRNNYISCVTNWQWKLLYTGNYRKSIDCGTGFLSHSLRLNNSSWRETGRRYKTFVDIVCLPKAAFIMYHGKNKDYRKKKCFQVTKIFLFRN